MIFRRNPVPQIDVRDASARLSAGELQLVDVREPAELARAQVAGARHVPLRELAARLGEVDPHRPVAFICRSGTRSALAARKAVKEGYEAVNVRGGMNAWARAGLPLIGDSEEAA